MRCARQVPLAIPVMVTVLMTALLAGCSDSKARVDDPNAAASAPVPGVTLPPGMLVDLVPTPSEVPPGMVPVVLGSGPRTLAQIAAYSGTGATQTQAAQALRTHGFQAAYVGQYANQATGQVLSAVVVRFTNAAGATADFSDDQRETSGTAVSAESLGDASSVTKRTISGSVTSELVLVRVLRGTDTWVLAYQAAPQADPAVAVQLMKALLARTTA